MSRIAKDPVIIPESVTVTTEGNTLNFKGPKGELSLDIHESVSFSIDDSNIQVIWKSSDDAAMAGTMRALINNYVLGVSEGYSKTITLNGVGYRAKVQGKKIELTLGFSRPVEYMLPEYVEAKSERGPVLELNDVELQIQPEPELEREKILPNDEE